MDEQTFHIVGVGGFGMSAIARVLLERGCTVSGSDQQANALSDALAADGAAISIGHAAGHVGDVDLVLRSSAIPDDNPEVQAARAKGIPVQERREFMARLMEHTTNIAVAGTHGKTTTTAMMIHTALEGGLDPSFIVGGILRNWGTNAGAGQGELFIIEADEYGNMFLGLNPHIAVVTNIEYDHPDFFDSAQAMEDVFAAFVGRLPQDGLLVACIDDPAAARFAQERRAARLPLLTYSVHNPDADFYADNIRTGKGVRFDVWHKGGQLGTVALRLPGKHNAQNALAIMAVMHHLGVPPKGVIDALGTFEGAGRRSEVMGEANGVRVVNDYAHHPTAINATLEAWRDQTDGKLWAVWQPHTYSRTRTLIRAFKTAFSAADHVLVTDIYPAREALTPGLLADDVAALIASTGHPDARYSGTLAQTANLLAHEVQPGDVVLLLTAGDLPQVGDKLLGALVHAG